MTSINDIAINEPSLCIPFVFANITEERIQDVFSHLDLGEIDRIDMVWRDSQSGGEHQRVFIHFKRWNSDENTTCTRQALLDEETIKVVYDDPWFWKISASRTRKPRPKGVVAPRPRIEIMGKQHKKTQQPAPRTAVRGAGVKKGYDHGTEEFKSEIEQERTLFATRFVKEVLSEVVAEVATKSKVKTSSPVTPVQQSTLSSVSTTTPPPPPKKLSRQSAWASASSDDETN